MKLNYYLVSPGVKRKPWPTSPQAALQRKHPGSLTAPLLDRGVSICQPSALHPQNVRSAPCGTACESRPCGESTTNHAGAGLMSGWLAPIQSRSAGNRTLSIVSRTSTTRPRVPRSRSSDPLLRQTIRRSPGFHGALTAPAPARARITPHRRSRQSGRWRPSRPRGTAEPMGRRPPFRTMSSKIRRSLPSAGTAGRASPRCGGRRIRGG